MQPIMPTLLGLPKTPQTTTPIKIIVAGLDLHTEISPFELIQKLLAGCAYGVSLQNVRNPLSITFTNVKMSTRKEPKELTNFEHNAFKNIADSYQIIESNPERWEETRKFITRQLKEIIVTQLNIEMEIEESFPDHELPYLFLALKRRVVSILFAKMTGIFGNDDERAKESFCEKGIKKLEHCLPDITWKYYRENPNLPLIILRNLAPTDSKVYIEGLLTSYHVTLHGAHNIQLNLTFIHFKRETLHNVVLPTLQPKEHTELTIDVQHKWMIEQNDEVITLVKDPEDPLLDTDNKVKLLKSDEQLTAQTLIEIIKLIQNSDNVLLWKLFFTKAMGRLDQELSELMWSVMQSKFSHGLKSYKNQEEVILRDLWLILIDSLTFQKMNLNNLMAKEKNCKNLIFNNRCFKENEVLQIFTVFKNCWHKLLELQKKKTEGIFLYSQSYREWIDIVKPTVSLLDLVSLQISLIYFLLQNNSFDELETALQDLEAIIEKLKVEKSSGRKDIWILTKQLPQKFHSLISKTTVEVRKKALVSLVEKISRLNTLVKSPSLNNIICYGILKKYGINISLQERLNVLEDYFSKENEENDPNNLTLYPIFGLLEDFKSTLKSPEERDQLSRVLTNPSINNHLTSDQILTFLKFLCNLYSVDENDTQIVTYLSMCLMQLPTLTYLKTPHTKLDEEPFCFYLEQLHTYVLRTKNTEFFLQHINGFDTKVTTLHPIFNYIYCLQKTIQNEKELRDNLKIVLKIVDIINDTIMNLIKRKNYTLTRLQCGYISGWVYSIKVLTKIPGFIDKSDFLLKNFESTPPQTLGKEGLVFKSGLQVCSDLFSNTLTVEKLKEYRELDTPGLVDQILLILGNLKHLQMIKHIPLSHNVETLIETFIPCLEKSMIPNYRKLLFYYIDPDFYPEVNSGPECFGWLIEKINKLCLKIEKSSLSPVNKALFISSFLTYEYIDAHKIGIENHLKLLVIIRSYIERLRWTETLVVKLVPSFYKHLFKNVLKWKPNLIKFAIDLIIHGIHTFPLGYRKA